MRADLEDAVGRRLGSPIRTASAVAGGDINEAYDVRLEDGRRVFVKAHPRGVPRMFRAEAKGLDWLREAGAVRVPRILAVGDAPGPEFLALEHLGSAKRSPGFDESLGRGLAELHRSGAPCFGLDHDNFIGPLPQPNSKLETWSDFYRERRIGFQLRLAVDRGRLGAGLARDFEALLGRLETLLGPPEPPARLHGDLWGGNLHVTQSGEPALIDPAAYGGHREVDLAMMKLFGGFERRVYQAYAEAFPLAPGHEQRVALYQLYPLLVHTNLFGGGYVASLSDAVRRYL